MNENENMVQETETVPEATEVATTEAKTGLSGKEKLAVAGVVILALAGAYHVVSKSVRAVKKGVNKVKAKIAAKQETVEVVEPETEEK